jgi:two-component system nitrate/nitrite response regulator NarL
MLRPNLGFQDMKILIVDDHAVLREGLAALLSASDPKPTIIEASTPSEGFALVDEHPDLDVLLLDLIMPGIKGMEALSEFGRRRPTLPVIVLSSSEDPRDVRRALAAGALGYVPKSAGQRVLFSAIQLVLSGEVYVPLLMLGDAISSPQDPRSQSGDPVDNILTARQIEILAFLCEGQPNKSIARKLGVSEKTIKAHITAIFKSLRVVNRTQAAAVARKAGLI